MINVGKYNSFNNGFQCNLRKDAHLLTELGVYELIFNSRKENAKLFKEKIFELLKRIRLG